MAILKLYFQPGGWGLAPPETERKLGMNIVCGWWKEEFDLSGVDWLDHDGRYDRAAEFLRSLYGLFQPPAVVKDATVAETGLKTQIEIDPSPSYGLDQSALPEIWIAGHSDRAVQMAAEWGHCLFLNGMSDEELKQRIETARQEANSWGRSIQVAANAYVIATEAADQARQRWKSVVAQRNSQTIDFFRTVIGGSGAAARWKKDSVARADVTGSAAPCRMHRSCRAQEARGLPRERLRVLP